MTDAPKDLAVKVLMLCEEAGVGAPVFVRCLAMAREEIVVRGGSEESALKVVRDSLAIINDTYQVPKHDLTPRVAGAVLKNPKEEEE